MFRKLIFFSLAVLMLSSCGNNAKQILSEQGILLKDSIQYHPVRVDAHGNILPWYSSNPGESYDTVISLVWNFWKNMEIDSNGLKYYMNHQVWKPEHDMRGLGGDQLNMALSSWTLLFAYTGDTMIIDNMRYIADYYLQHSYSSPTDKWPSLPYPYNTKIHSGKYDGDMRAGKGFLQPDKAANFGLELVNLYKITGTERYLSAARGIALNLAAKVRPGDNNNSPLPFRVNAETGKIGPLLDNGGSGKTVDMASYTSNWAGLLMLWQQLMKLDPGNTEIYEKSFRIILNWMKEYPLKTNKWGPFFEDIPGWSDTQTNAVTFAMFILLNQDLFPEWRADVKGILKWTHKELANHEYEKYKVTVMNEQTVYRVPGNSHSSRQASVELWYGELSGDTFYRANAIRTLNWATYTVSGDGRNRYIHDDIWLTDGYGDYLRHFIRAMAAEPELAPDNKNRLLRSSSVISKIHYSPSLIEYESFDSQSMETLRLMKKPIKVLFSGKEISEQEVLKDYGWSWNSLSTGGVLIIKHKVERQIKIEFR